LKSPPIDTLGVLLFKSLEAAQGVPILVVGVRVRLQGVRIAAGIERIKAASVIFPFIPSAKTNRPRRKADGEPKNILSDAA
jgi:hypothetical protein